jgi:pimeloyl-ACP methyl ester carboxylesterase
MQEYGPAAFLKEVIPGLYAESFRSASPQMIQAHLAESTQWATAEALTAYYRAMMSRPDRTHVLADFKGPILFILGALDKTVVLEETIPQTKLTKHSFVQVMEAAAHMGMREDPRSTSLALIDFILARKRP